MLDWTDIALRLGLTLLAGTLIGLDRSGHDRPAGLRTTVLVCLAASVAMIQVDLLLPVSGKSTDSYVVLDLMRLPLGILSGVGFIGGGAILHRESRAVGVTTAATLWIATVIGLCLGGGQIGLGVVATALAMVVLMLFKLLERRMSRLHRARLSAEIESDDAAGELRRLAAGAGFHVNPVLVAWHDDRQCREVNWELRWCSRRAHPDPPAFLAEFSDRPGVRNLRWELVGNSGN